MEMINRVIGDALDSAEFVKRLKAMDDEQHQAVSMELEGRTNENRAQRRAREKAERRATGKVSTRGHS